ncbi:MAG TPA: tetratricopeptide repeat protein [Pyrinomonadaceae bacterium]|nr:tetratricopeptide repeat protein [Pyrinomonadaceae bacterium]
MHLAPLKFNARRAVIVLALTCVFLAPPQGARAQQQQGANDLAGQLERAASLIGGDQLAEAERLLNQVLKVRPQEAVALNLLGAIRAKQGKLDEAEVFFSRAIGSDKKLTGARMNLAYLFLLKGQPEKTAAELREVLRLEPANAEATYRLAWVLLSQNRTDECINLVEQVRQQQQQTLSAPLLAVLGDAYMRRGDRGKAMAALKSAIELNPNEPSYHYTAGVGWLKHPADLQEAEQSFRRFLTLRPGDAQGQLHLGYVLLKQKRHAEARELLERSLQTGAGTPEAFYYLGLIAQGQNEDERAIGLFEKSIQLAPSFGHVHIALGSTYLKLKDYARAQSALETGAKLTPDDTKAHYNLALLYSRLKQPERAREEMLIVERLKGEGKARDVDEGDTFAPPPSSPPR